MVRPTSARTFCSCETGFAGGGLEADSDVASRARARFQNSFKQLQRRRIRLHAQFAPQHAHALVIGAQRTRPVVIGRMQPDQQLMVRLAQRIQRDQALSPRDCRCVILLFFEERGETMQHLGDPPPVIFAQRGKPVIVESRQKVVFIELRRGCEGLVSLARGRSPFARQLASAIAAWKSTVSIAQDAVLPPLNREMVGHQQVAFGRQRPFQMVEKLPQIRPRLRFTGGRPQHKGQPLARLRRIAMKDQICDQRVETVRVDGA